MPPPAAPSPSPPFPTPSGHTYSYIHIPPSTPNPTILILHGFPSTPQDFHHQITHLTSPNQGYGILVPSLLGYNPTSTPTTPTSYTLKSQCSDIKSLTFHLSILPPLFCLAHDFGCTLASRLNYYQPNLISRTAYLTIGPPPISQPFDLNHVNTLTKQALGYEAFGYQKFFIDNPQQASALLERNHDRMEQLMFAANADLWIEYFGRIGGLEAWLKGAGPKDVRMIEGVTKEDSRQRREVFCPGDIDQTKAGEFGPGYSGPLMWYVVHNMNLNVEDERMEREDWESWKSDKEVLLVVCDNDPIALPSMQIDMAKSFVKDGETQLRVEHLDSGHFVMYELSNELNQLLEDFFGR